MKPIRICLLLVACLFCSRLLHAQNDFYHNEMDSLHRALSKQKTTKDSILILQKLVDFTPIRAYETSGYPDDVSKLLELNKRDKVIEPLPYELLKKGNEYWNNKQYKEALAVLQSAVTEFDKQHKNIYTLLLNMRFLYNFLNDQNSRFTYYQCKLEYYQVNGPYENTAPCYHAIAGYYNNKGAYNQAINNYLKAGEVFKKFAPFAYTNALGVVGSVYASWGNNTKAMYYLQQVVKYEQEKKKVYNVQFIYSSLSLIYFNEEQYPQALKQINKAIDTIEKKPSQRLAGAYVFKAGILLKMNQPAEAFSLLNKVKAMADSVLIQTVSANGMMEIDYDYYLYYLTQNDIPKAEASLLQAEAASRTQNGEGLELKYLRELGYFYQRQNKPALAVKYFNQYFNRSDADEKVWASLKWPSMKLMRKTGSKPSI